MGRRVRKGEKGIAILAPITARVDPGSDPDRRTARARPPGGGGLGPAGPPGVVELTGATATALIEAALITRRWRGQTRRPVLRGFKVTTVFDISQTEGETRSARRLARSVRCGRRPAVRAGSARGGTRWSVSPSSMATG